MAKKESTAASKDDLAEIATTEQLSRNLYAIGTATLAIKNLGIETINGGDADARSIAKAKFSQTPTAIGKIRPTAKPTAQPRRSIIYTQFVGQTLSRWSPSCPVIERLD